MIKNFFLILFLVFSINNNPKNDLKKELIIQNVNYELRLHPEATLIDIYKNFFQGAFGPGHLIDDLNSAVNYLRHELESAAKFDTVLWQPVGYDKQYIRVNLMLVKDGNIPIEKLSEAFFKSANSYKPPSIESWIEEWDLILKVIEEMNLSIINFEEDKYTIQSLLKTGKPVVHHSDLFISLYNPHYRIISKEYIKELEGYFKN